MDQFKVETLSPGDGVNKPKNGQNVTVHYTGTFPDGQVFDTSFKRNKPFQFQLGMGKVIKGWDLGVAQMTKGEKARITCPYQYAYGENGYPGVIPPKQTLIFEVELLDFQ